jgi:alcohol dehydrogenase class IV
MKPFTFYVPTKIIFGRGTLAKIGEEAAKLGAKCLVVSGKSFAKKSGYLAALDKNLSQFGLKNTSFAQVESNPSIDTIYAGLELANKNDCDTVIGLGGGSAIDAAKAIAFLIRNGAKPQDLFFPREIVEPTAPVIAIPTTCGTGSEVTKYSVLTDQNTKRKRVMVGLPLMPRVALLDPNVLDIIPQDLLAYTGFDALSHSFEALLSRNSNNLSDAMASESGVAICRNLAAAYDGSPESKEKVFYGSMLAGVAINAAGTVILHGMGYYLTTYHNIHHGLANAVLLSHVLRFEGELAREKFESIALNLGLNTSSSLFEFIEKLADKVGIPKSLSDLGVKFEELEAMVSDAMSYSRNLENNPKSVSAKEIADIYQKAFMGR